MLNLAQAQRPKDDESCPLGYTPFNVRTATVCIDSLPNLPIASTRTDASRLLVYTYLNVCTSTIAGVLLELYQRSAGSEA